MTSGLRALLSGVIDYAGMFPPAQLPLEPAIRNYARYRMEPESWMLGRFICQAAKLAELSPFVDELFASGAPLSVSALGRGGGDEVTFIDGLKHDLLDMSLFREQHGDRVALDVFETKLPANAGLLNQTVVPAARRLFASNGPANLKVFYEQAILAAKEDIAQFDGAAGHKVRCGGLSPEAFPSIAYLALAIAQAPGCCIPLKFTAGLHHPVRRFDANVNTTMYGFLNIFAAGVFAASRRLDHQALRLILEDEQPNNFVFDDAGLRWRDLRATVTEIEEARAKCVISFGSCSFDEPREDLRTMGLL